VQYSVIGKKFGLERRTISKIIDLLNLPVRIIPTKPSPLATPEKIKTLKEMVEAGKTADEIITSIGGSRSAVSRLKQRIDVSTPVDVFASLQSDKMKNAWTEEMRIEAKRKAIEMGNRPEVRALLSKLSLALWKNPEYYAKQVEIQRSIWGTPEMRAKLAKMRESQPKVSSIQNILYSILDDVGISFFREYIDKPCDSECIIGPYTFDCVVPRPGRRTLLIECQGDYWHSQERHIRCDRSKASYIFNNFEGQYELKYLWEHEFKQHERIVQTVKHWLGIASIDVCDFNFGDVEIKIAPAVEYKLLLSKYHYLSNAGRGGITFGAYLNNILIAICVFSPLLRQNISVEGVPWEQIRELSRLCIHPKYQKKNFASWFVSRAIKSLDAKFKAIISYCDTTFNHDGAIYKSLNFVQDKIIRPDYWYVAEN
jgi:hypothetical protein